MQFRLVIITLLTILTTGFAYSQTLTGKVTNSRNEPITGASVIIVGTNAGASSNVEGHYSISLSAGKKYEIRFSALGYRSKVVDNVEASANMEELNIVLEDSAGSMEGVVVRATSRRQENTAALLTFQKNNTAVSSVIAADFIRRTPDKNTGEVLKRVSGASIQDNKFVIIRGLSDRYNSAYINGAQLPSSEPDKKAFSFDVIPSQLIDNIVINKTATPDLTGEFAGGLVQITTKDIPTRNELNVGVSLGFNTQSAFKDFYSNPRGNNDWLGFSDRKLPGSFPTNANEYNSLTPAEQAEKSKLLRDDVYQQVKSTAIPTQQYNVTWSNAIKGKNGGTLGSVVGVTYRQSKLVYNGSNAVQKLLPGYFDYDDSQNRYSVNWGAVANIAWTKGSHKIAFKNLFNQLLDDNYYTRNGYNEDNLQNVKLYSSVLNQRSLYTSQLEGTHGLWNDIKLYWNLNYAYNDKQVPDLRVQTYTQSDGSSQYILNTRGNNTNRFFSTLNDNAFGYNANVSIPFDLGAQKQTVKVGAAGTGKVRRFKATILGYNDPTDQSLTALPYDQIFNRENFKPDGFIFTTALQNPSDKYFGASALNAAFIMFDNKLSESFRIVWGVRGENFEQFLKSNDVRLQDTALIIHTKKFDLLPSINVTYSPTVKTNIRLSGSRTIARPEFREIAPFQFFDFEQLASTIGNETLKRSSILNGDLRYEFYPKGGELLSFGLFYKYFQDPIELRLNPESGGTRRVYVFQNAEKANLQGLEIEFRKSLDFVSSTSSFLSDLYFNGNITGILSKVTLQNIAAGGEQLASTSRPLQGQSPYLINAGFQYDNKDKGLGFSMLYNRIGQRLALVGNTSFPDIYENPRDLVDLQISKKVFKGNGEVKLTASDILNQRIMTYQNVDSKKVYKEGTDHVFSSYTPGTTFSLGFNYNFKL